MPPLDAIFRELLDQASGPLMYLRDLWPDQFILVFWAFCFLEVPRYFLSDLYVLFSALRDKWRHKPPVSLAQLHSRPLVSVVLAALNEESTIEATVRSLLEQSYPNLEIVVIDDGSNDRTAEICQRLADSGLLRYYRFFSLEERQGKSAALNYGIRAARGELLVFMDTDSTLDRDSILNMVAQFEDPEVGAVCGDLRVRNLRDNLLTRLQGMEYITSLMVGRRFRAAAGILSIVPGALGAFRSNLIQRVGGHEPGPGNDSDLTIRIRKLRKKIVFAEGAVCLTNAPTRWPAWFRQRSRWDRNLVRNRLRRHKDVYNPGLAGFDWRTALAFVDTMFFSVFLTLVWAVYFIHLLLVDTPERPGVIIAANFFLHMLLKLSQYLVALLLCERWREYLTLIVYTPFFGLYRILQKLVRILAVTQELLLRWSYYRDPFAPEKVRNQMEVF